MAIRFLKHATLIAAFAAFVAAQDDTIIPEDLRSGFRSGGDEVQVSFTGEAINGFKDGTVFEKDAVAKEPTFALGDSSGISPGTLYTIIMVDSTCPNARKLHYARANFKNNFDITNIETDSPAVLDYVAPGSVGEKGDDRQYSFLMYTNPGRKEITDLQLPGDDEAFNITKFQDDNGLGDAMAGVGMVVKLGGQADCAGGSAEALPSSLPTPRPASSTTVRVSTATGGSSAAASATPTDDANSPSSAATPTPTSAASGRPANSVAPSSGSPPSSAAETPATVSTIVLSSAEGTGSPTAAATAPEQTANAASGKMYWPRWAVASVLLVSGSMIMS
ncbi:hypothetical protein J4E83_010270 [Alternaria metachromatica]|uniref:uncharacterized protein n=1 Tax=Alternaria metachromatica TaxID=283354 RepID=UPI0020C37F57|nr:uncharacterized protein J4E83_010270 [Alternaria metachromatica]KAI4606004.1 hypothetical protein J4E83_010270 [Alternaria metachromatica]